MGFDIELRDGLLEELHPLAPHRRVFGGVREIAGEDDEVWAVLQAVDGGDDLSQRSGGVGVHFRAVESEVDVGDLDEVELARRGGGGALGAG